MLNVMIEIWTYSDITGNSVYKKLNYSGIDEIDFFVNMIEKFGEKTINDEKNTIKYSQDKWETLIIKHIPNSTYLKQFHFECERMTENAIQTQIDLQKKIYQHLLKKLKDK